MSLRVLLYLKRTIELFKFLNDETFAEAEIFILFDKIMKVGQQEMFRPNVEDPNKKKQPINPLRPIKSEVFHKNLLNLNIFTIFFIILLLRHTK